MAVYVDDMKAKFGRMTMCHMAADSLEELNAMADKIGVQRKWLQNKKSFPHYDICLSKKRLAIKNGAIEVSQKKIVMMYHKRLKNAD